MTSPKEYSPQKLPDLVLHLKREYYDQIHSGEKTEEYREMSDYWIKRLVGKKYQLIYIVPGYPKGNQGALIMPYRGYEVKEITHSLFGQGPVKVFAIRLTDEKCRESSALLQQFPRLGGKKR